MESELERVRSDHTALISEHKWENMQYFSYKIIIVVRTYVVAVLDMYSAMDSNMHKINFLHTLSNGGSGTHMYKYIHVYMYMYVPSNVN